MQQIMLHHRVVDMVGYVPVEMPEWEVCLLAETHPDDNYFFAEIDTSIHEPSFWVFSYIDNEVKRVNQDYNEEQVSGLVKEYPKAIYFTYAGDPREV